MLDSDVESEVGAATGGLEFTPKALPREKPALSSPPRVEEVVDEGEQEQPDATEHRARASANASRSLYEPGQPFYMHSVLPAAPALRAA